MHLNEAFSFQSQLIKMLDDSWVIVGDLVETMENQNESLGAENFEYAVENVGYYSPSPDS